MERFTQNRGKKMLFFRFLYPKRIIMYRLPVWVGHLRGFEHRVRGEIRNRKAETKGGKEMCKQIWRLCKTISG